MAVIDSGIAPSHPDLPSTILWENEAEKNGVPNKDDGDRLDYVDDVNGVNFTSLLPPGLCAQVQKPNDLRDETGHGTHITGIIAGTGNNHGSGGIGKGMVGINGNGQVKIMPLKIFCKGTNTLTQ